MESKPFSCLFVCMGNICRSPAGEGVLRALLEQEGLDHVEVDSAGTIGFHSGNPADARMREAAAGRGYHLSSRARQVQAADLDRFDLILVMDEENYQDVLALAETGEQRTRVRRFCEFCRDHNETDVPDPYYGGPDGFEKVLDLLEDGCRGVLESIVACQKKNSPS